MLLYDCIKKKRKITESTRATNLITTSFACFQVLSRTALPVRLSLVYNPEAVEKDVSLALKSISEVTVDININSNSGHSYTPVLPPLEQKRRDLQSKLLQGWGLFYDMSYTDQVLLPHGARIRLAVCEVDKDSGGKCLQEARIDWPETGNNTLAPNSTIRPGVHTYDRSYAHLYLDVLGCNISIASGGGTELNVLAKVVNVNATACKGLALVPLALTTWHRSNQALVESLRSFRFKSQGFDDTFVHTSRGSQNDLLLPLTVSQPHLKFQLKEGFSLSLNSGPAPKPLAEVEALLNKAKMAEEERISVYGDLKETKSAVQSAVMWQVISNPLEQGPLAPVIRGNPWGLDARLVNDDWGYVIFDWDNHFGAYMLSLDAKEQTLPLPPTLNPDRIHKP